jgi:hypothetical protein
VRAGRVFKWKERNSLEPTLELFNALNAAPAETVNYINGTGTNKFGYVSAVMPPFIGRFGVTYRF